MEYSVVKVSRPTEGYVRYYGHYVLLCLIYRTYCGGGVVKMKSWS